MKAIATLAVVALAATAWSAAPASAVPTGTYESNAPLRIVAQPGDEEVHIDVVTSSAPLGSPYGGYTSITGDVQLTYAPGACASYPGAYECASEPSLIVLDGGGAHADLSVTGWSEYVPAKLKAGQRGGRLAMWAVDYAQFVGRRGPDRVVYDTEEFPKIHYLRVNGARGDDVVVLKGAGGAMRDQHGGVAQLFLGGGNDRFAARTAKPSPVRVYGLAGQDELDAGPGDLVYGGQARDVLTNGRVLVGGPGPDKLSGGPSTRVIGAADGEPDVIRCVSDRTVAYVDALDRVSGPCRVRIR